MCWCNPCPHNRHRRVGNNAGNWLFDDHGACRIEHFDQFVISGLDANSGADSNAILVVCRQRNRSRFINNRYFRADDDAGSGPDIDTSQCFNNHPTGCAGARAGECSDDDADYWLDDSQPEFVDDRPAWCIGDDTSCRLDCGAGQRVECRSNRF